MWILGSNIAKSFSVVLQPLLMPLYSVALLFVYTNFYVMYNGQVLAFLFPVVLLTFVIPGAFIVILKNMRYIKDYNLSNRFDRTLPYLIFIVSNISLIYFFSKVQVPFWFLGLIISPGLIALVALIINFFWKISVHMLGIGGLIGSVISICFNIRGSNPYGLFIMLFILAGCLGVSRLYLRANSAAQVYIGFIIGFAIAYLATSGLLFFLIPMSLIIN
jgi:hypothetical protein